MLANLYRPKSFSDVIGQDITITILENLIAKNELPTSLLFVGPAGCGKTTCARILAQGKEVFEIDCASNNGVSDVKEITNLAKKASLTNRHKVFILDEAHTLSAAAWSSLLITLEEGISFSTFIFCTTNDDKIPDTILSRVMRFSFYALNEATIYEQLHKICTKEKIQFEENGLKLIARLSTGNMRAALANIDKCALYGELTLENVQLVLNILGKRAIYELFNYIREDKLLAVNRIKEIQNQGYNLYTVMETALRYFVYDSYKRDTTKELDFILEIMNDLKYMIANPGNVCNFICAKVLTHDWTK